MSLFGVPRTLRSAQAVRCRAGVQTTDQSWPLLSGFLFGLQNLAALVHAGLQIEVVRTAQFAGILVLNVSGLLERVRRAAHATARRRGFSAGNGHFGVL